MKEELRPCIVNIAKVTERYRTNRSAKFQTRVIREAETHKGWFHTWGMKSFTLYGVVEYEDGTVHEVSPEYITFINKDCKE